MSSYGSGPATAKAARTLGLAGDGDESDLIEAVEAAFRVEFSEAETSTWHTVGDLFEALKARIPPSKGDGRCLSAMAFYRLRAAIGAGKVRPSTQLAAVLHGGANRSLAGLAHASGLAMPAKRLGSIGNIGFWLLFAGGTGILATLDRFPVAAVAFAALIGGAIWMLVSDEGRFPVETIGELAEQVAHLNVGKLALQGADMREPAMWGALLGIIRAETGLSPSDEICRETAFI